MADGGVGERLASAHIDLGGLPGGQVVHEEVNDRVVDAGLRIRLDIDTALELRVIELEKIWRHGFLVETVEGELAAVGRPPHRRALRELLAIHPAAGTVLRLVLVVAVRRHGDLDAAGRAGEVDIAVAVERVELLVRGFGRLELPPAFGGSATASAPASRRLRWGDGPDVGGCLRADVVPKASAVPRVFERPGVLPRDRDLPGFHRITALLADLLKLPVAGHRLQPVLGRRNGAQDAGRERRRQREPGHET
ncbi:MAG TPA: hypothetical protein VNJ03_18140 [Vicinamibacterales bacterium]|nr:hypothetical protein [Vicinamibacterales bacterium]